MIDQARPHCVILDVLMPGMGGHELATRLRDLFGDDIVLIAISGHERAAAEVRQAFETVDHYLQKPFEFSELSKILRHCAKTVFASSWRRPSLTREGDHNRSASRRFTCA